MESTIQSYTGINNQAAEAATQAPEAPVKTTLKLTETPVKDMTQQLDPSGWLIRATGQLAEPNGTYVCIHGPDGEPRAAAVVVPADQSQFQQVTRLPESALDTSIYISSIWVSPKAKAASTLPAILYLALRRARILGRQNVAAIIPTPNSDIPLATLMNLEPLDNVPAIQQEGTTYQAMGQRLKYSIIKLYNQCSGDELALIKENFLDEILEIHAEWVERFFSGPWAQAVRLGTITKQQYIYSLYNLHQYVRMTTRIAARCIAFADNRDMRNHYIYHLKGEVNHELFIESDLKHLGADVDYVLYEHVPHPATKEFMMAQESSIGYYQNPLMLSACPLAAEGIAAHMPQEFLDALYETIASWGVKDPIKAAGFLRSHTITDGGEDGHWRSLVGAITQFITDEFTQQHFLCYMTLAMNGFEHGFNANINDLQLWSVKPEA